MKYGYFDQVKREYIITKPDTPAPWVNYLGSPEYGAIISNNAGGYSFEKSGAKGRILRYRFNSDDKPGRYIYIRDDDTNDYWTASWQPVGKNQGYKNKCRHGLGYTILETEYSGIKTETTYYVPLNRKYEVWRHKVKNITDRERKLSIFGYAEFTNDSDYEQDMINLQYSLFTSRTYFKGNKIVQSINGNSKEVYNRFFCLVNAPIISYSGDKRSFIGNYNSYGNPKSVVKGICENTLNYNLNSCGALHTQLNLLPNEEREMIFILGQYDEKDSSEIISGYTDMKETNIVDRELKVLEEYWRDNLSAFKVETPDENFNNMINIWNAYQCFINFTWSRAASFIYCGQRNGYGFRDTVQDIQGVIHLRPDLAKKQIIFMVSAQVSNGAGLPLVKYSHTPGREDTPDDFSYVKETGHPSYRADDALWLFPTINKYIKETGDIGFLDEVIPYADKGEDPLYKHLKRAIEFSMNRLGTNGLPAGLHADWNDCLRLGKNGESTFVAMQLYLALDILEEFSNIKQDYNYKENLFYLKIALGDKINDICFEGDRYIRGITEDNLRIGAKDHLEANLWLNPQSWAVISGLADTNRSKLIMDNVYRNLNTQYGVRLMSPSFKEGFKGALATVYNGSTKENGSIFLQTQGWLILAESLMGRGNRAYEYYKASCPAHQNEISEIRQMEPYVYGQFTESVESPYEGRSHVHWLTGTASTIMVACVEGILGIRPDMAGIFIEPSIPCQWNNVMIEKVFRGKNIKIYIQNNEGNESGYKEVYLNNIKLENNYIRESELKEFNEILYIM